MNGLYVDIGDEFVREKHEETVADYRKFVFRRGEISVGNALDVIGENLRNVKRNIRLF